MTVLWSTVRTRQRMVSLNLNIIDVMLVTFSHGYIVTLNTFKYELVGRLSGDYVSAIWLEDGRVLTLNKNKMI